MRPFGEGSPRVQTIITYFYFVAANISAGDHGRLQNIKICEMMVFRVADSMSGHPNTQQSHTQQA